MEGGLRAHRVPAILVVFLTSFVVLLLAMDLDINLYDEGLVLVDGMRVLAGELIHRDYYSPYGPAAYYVMAGLLKLGDHGFLLARVYAVATHAAIVAVCFGILVSRARPWICFTFAAGCAAWLLASESYLYPLYQALLLALASSWLLLEPTRVGHKRLVMAGACTGLAALFRYDAAFFVMVAHAAAILLLPVDQQHGVHRRTKAVVAYACGVGAVFLPFMIAFLLSAPLGTFIADIIDYPMKYYVRMRGLPMPDLAAIAAKPMRIAVYLPSVVILAGIWLLTRARTRAGLARADDPQAQLFVVFTLLTTLVYYKGFVRAEPLHMTLAIVPAGVLAAVIVDRLWRRRQSRWLAIGLMVLTLMPSALLAAARLAHFQREPARLFAARLLGASSGTDRCPAPAAWWPMRQPSYYATVARYLDSVVPRDEPIYVGLRAHDRIYINTVALYYTANRLPATHWHQFDPGLQNRDDVQREMIAEFERQPLHWIVRDASYDEVREPNESQRSSGVHLLDDYLDAHFRPVMGAGPVEVWAAREVMPPAWPAIPAGCGADRIFDQSTGQWRTL